MRKLVFFIILTFIVFIPIAEAKTILYVTNSSTDDPCSSLRKSDSLFCERLKNLTYSVRVINERHVQENSSVWSDYADSSDMIFLGSVSNSEINKSVFQDSFCGNISGKMGGKPIFMTLENVWLKPDIEGCAFYTPINLANFSYDENNCTEKNFKITKEGFVTEGYSLWDTVSFYSSDKRSRIQDPSENSWISVECVPPNGTIQFYPVVSIVGKNVFWGLVEPESYTEDAWKTFDRTVLYALGDNYWSFDTRVLPSVITANESFWIISNVTRSGKQVEGKVNFTLDGSGGELGYSDGLWRKTDVKLSEEREYTLTLNGYSQYGFQGSHSENLKSGSLSVRIDSLDYFRAGKSYAINVTALLGSEPQVAVVSFRVLDSKSFEVFLSGNLDCNNSMCGKTIENMPNKDSLILEVTAQNGTRYGGKIKILNKKLFFIEKSVYRPGEVLLIELFPPSTTSSANLTIARPDGSNETLPLSKISDTYWAKNYSLGTAIPNGTYSLSIRYGVGGNYTVLNQAFFVLSWEPYAFLNKQNFYAFEILNLTVGIANSFSSTLTTNVNVEIYDSKDSLKFSRTGTITGNGEFSATNLIGDDYPADSYDVRISLTDSDGRSAAQHLGFTVNEAGSTPLISVSPATISETNIENKIISKRVIVENSAEDINITNLIVNVSGIEKIVEIIGMPNTLNAKEKADAEIRLNTFGISPGVYSGEIHLYSQVGKADISVNLKIIGDVSSQADNRLEELTALESNLTKIKKVVDASEVSSLIEEIRELLLDAKGEYASERYENAESKYQSAMTKMEEVSPKIAELYKKIPDYSSIIWTAAYGIVIVIIIITIVKYGKRIKGLIKREKKKEGTKEEESEVYFEPKGGEYRTEYY